MSEQVGSFGLCHGVQADLLPIDGDKRKPWVHLGEHECNWPGQIIKTLPVQGAVILACDLAI